MTVDFRIHPFLRDRQAAAADEWESTANVGEWAVERLHLDAEMPGTCYARVYDNVGISALHRNYGFLRADLILAPLPQETGGGGRATRLDWDPCTEVIP